MVMLLGLGLNLTPCVYPLISVTVAYFGTQGHHRSLRVAALAAVYVLGITISFFAMFSLYFVNAQFLQYTKGFDPLITGLAILPATASLYLSSLSSARLAERVGTKTVLMAGMLFMAFGLCLISICGPTTPYLWYALALAIVALVTAVASGPVKARPALAIATSIPPKRSTVPATAPWSASKSVTSTSK